MVYCLKIVYIIFYRKHKCSSRYIVGYRGWTVLVSAQQVLLAVHRTARDSGLIEIVVLPLLLIVLFYWSIFITCYKPTMTFL